MKHIVIAFFMFISNLIFAQNSVSGIIKDSNGDPIPGATIIDEKDPNNGTISDFDGNFNIIINPTSSIDVSFVGFETKSIEINGQSFCKKKYF